ncbi:MAG TPA: S41 family peptidase [Acidimicrobiia bacterium]|nr:S41 family peptidase [Acidimicrobiia bacterium]
MIRRFDSRLVWWLLALTIFLGACESSGGDATSPTTSTIPPTTAAPTTSAPESTTTAPTTTEPAPTTSAPVARDFETAPCGELSGALLCEAYELIRRHYVDPVTDEALVDGALSALASADVPAGEGFEVCPLPSDEFVELCETVADGELDGEAAAEAALAGMTYLALDPNSGYFDAETLELIEEEQSGQIEGIGALVATEEEGSDQPNSCQIISPTCRLRVVSTIEGGPARAADLQPDDEFLAVDGESIEGWTVDQVTSLVRGPAGTDVDLTMSRGSEEFTVTLTRATVQVPVVESEAVGDVAYIKLNIFTDNADEQLRGELEPLLEQGASTIVLDLRNNPGGLLETAINVTSEFLDEGLVVKTESPESVTPYSVTPGGIATDSDLEVYVVVNQGSASASEVVAGALADANRALVVGQNTFGKNTVQQRFPLSNGGAVKLTIARWLTPDGHDFGEGGITPDVNLELGEDLTAAEVVEQVTAVAA